MNPKLLNFLVQSLAQDKTQIPVMEAQLSAIQEGLSSNSSQGMEGQEQMEGLHSAQIMEGQEQMEGLRPTKGVEGQEQMEGFRPAQGVEEQTWMSTPTSRGFKRGGRRLVNIVTPASVMEEQTERFVLPQQFRRLPQEDQCKMFAIALQQQNNQ